MPAHSKSDLNIHRRELLVIVFVIVNTFIWYFGVFHLFRGILETVDLAAYETMIIWSIHFGAVIGAALIGATLSGKLISRSNLISLWLCLGVVSSFAPIVFTPDCFTAMAVNSLLFGISFGLGSPSCMAYFADSINIEKRGRLGGSIWFAVAIGAFILGITTMFIESLTGQSIIFTVWRVIALIIFVFFKPKNMLKVKKYPSYPSILHNKRFLLYFIPWITFCVINWLIVPIIPAEILYVSTLIQLVLVAIFAFIGGVLSDLVGRKPVIIAGLIMLGLGYASLGILEGTLAYYLFTVMDGIAWGMFAAVFLMILWGDLSGNMMSEKYYAIGALPYPLSGFLQQLLTPYIAQAIPRSAAFSFASFFLFLAIMPLLYAAETLPEKKIRQREFKEYIKRAKKIREKYS